MKNSLESSVLSPFCRKYEYDTSIAYHVVTNYKGYFIIDFVKSRFSQEEIELIDSLVTSLDKDNILIAEVLINSKQDHV